MGKRLPVNFFDDRANIETALRPIVAELGGRMPTGRELRSRGHQTLAKVIGKLGGPAAVAKTLGISKVKVQLPDHHYDNLDNLRAALLPIVAELGGRMPTHPELYSRGQSGLSVAILKLDGLTAVAKILGVSTVGIKLRKGQYENLESVSAALLPIVAELGGRMPMQSELKSRREGGLSRAIGKLGGPATVAKMLGIRMVGIKLRKGHYDDLENLRADLLPIVAELDGRMPTQPELQNRGKYRLCQVIGKLGGPAAVAKMLGISTVGVRLRKGQYDDFESLKAALLPIVAELGGRMPTGRELEGRRHSTLAKSIGKHGGPLAVAKLLGIGTEGIKLPTHHYDDFENVRAALLPIVAELGGRMPMQRELGSRGHSSLAAAVSEHGGFPAVAARLGLSPITEDTIVSRAAEMNSVLLAIDLPDPMPLWVRMMTRWLTHDLDAALAAFAETGSLDAFRRLLADP